MVEGSLIVNNNNASNSGAGVIQIGYAENNVVSPQVPTTLTITGGVSLNGNSSYYAGGAIDAIDGDVFLATNDGDVFFTGNSSTGNGGTISGNNITIGNANGTVTIDGNTAGTRGGARFGGAIYNIASGNNIKITGTAIALSGNTLHTTSGGGGGGLATAGNLTVEGPLVAGGNTIIGAGAGGAIYAGGVELDATGGNITFSPVLINGQSTPNSAGTQGGAIWTAGNVTLNATSGNITFSNNTENTATTAQANAIWIDNSGTAPPSISTFDAAAGYNITFQDPIQNNPANGLIDVVVNDPNTGTVIFDGSLYAGNAADQWSQVYGNTSLQGGTMIVENDAVYGALANDVKGTAGGSSFTVAGGTLTDKGNTAITTGNAGTGNVRADTFAMNGGVLDISGSSSIGNPAGTVAGGFGTFSINTEAFSGNGSGTVLFNTVLNDASTQLSDVLTISPTATTFSGSTKLQIANVSNPNLGALTKDNGILVVAYTGSAIPPTGTFVLANSVSANNYQYVLAFVPGQGWFLQSFLVVPAPMLSQWALGLLALMLVSGGLVMGWRRNGARR